MRLQRIVSRWGFTQPEEPEDAGEYGVVEVQYKDGRIEELELNNIEQLTIHARYPDPDPEDPNQGLVPSPDLKERQELRERLHADLLEVAEWFGDEEHGEPLTSETTYTGKLEDWRGYLGQDGRPKFQLSERSYVALCAALDCFDQLYAQEERERG